MLEKDIKNEEQEKPIGRALGHFLLCIGTILLIFGIVYTLIAIAEGNRNHQMDQWQLVIGISTAISSLILMGFGTIIHNLAKQIIISQQQMKKMNEMLMELKKINIKLEQ